MMGYCDEGQCIAGLIGSTPISQKDWDAAVDEFEQIIEIWNTKTRRFAVPHPGYIHSARFCITCGKKL